MLPPLFLARTNGSTLLESLNIACPRLSIDRLCEYAKFVPCITLVLTSDLCGSNGRLKQWVVYKISEHNREAVSS